MNRPLADTSVSARDASHLPGTGDERAWNDGPADWLVTMFQRLRLGMFTLVAALSVWWTAASDWGAGPWIATLTGVLAVDSAVQLSRSDRRPVGLTMAVDALAIAAVLAAGRFPIAVSVAAFTILLSAGALQLETRDTVRFYGLLGVLGVIVGRLASTTESPWTDGESETLTVLSIGVIPLLIVVMLVAAGREAGVSRVLLRRLDATEAALRETELRFGRAFGSAPTGLVIIDLAGSIMKANDSFASLVEVEERQSLVGTSLFEFIDPSEDEMGDDEFVRLLDNAPSNLHDRRLITRTGRSVWTVMSFSLVDDEDGAASKCIVHVVDVSERRQSHEALAESNQRLDALHRITRAGLEADDMSAAAAAIVSVISEVYGFVGVSICVHNAEAETMRAIAAVPPGKSLEETPIDEALCAPAALGGRTVVHSSPDGLGSTSDPAVKTVFSVPLNIDDEATGALTLTDHRLRTISSDLESQLIVVADHVAAFLRRMKVESQLETLIRSKDQFIASVSHEVRTPLTAVVGLAAELRDRHNVLDENEHREILEIVAEQSTEVANIVEDLLVAARSDLDNLNLKTESFRVESQLTQVIRELDRAPDAKLVHIDVAGEPLAVGDRGRFRQIVRNLLTNAFRYGGDDVEIRAAVRGDDVVVTVVDNGTGIPERDWERVFEPYRRSHEAGSQPGSVGIGLTVSRKLAHLMGGELSYRFIDGESRFRLVLPSETEQRYQLDRSA